MTSAAKATVIAQGTCVLVLFSKEDVQRATAEAADPDALEGGHDGELSSLYSLEIAKQIGEGMFGKVTTTLIEVWNSQWQHLNTLRQRPGRLKQSTIALKQHTLLLQPPTVALGSTGITLTALSSSGCTYDNIDNSLRH